ncbi:MAG TPA: phosphopentomutase [Acidobacteriota bacterium]|nr:phosphopentomutase [Acidobacteriota bacterium]
MQRFNRFVLMVLDSAGIGELPDAAHWGDAGTDTIGHVVAKEKPQLPNLRELGLGNIRPLHNLPPVPIPVGAFGKAAIFSNGKDTTVGHWEMTGLITPVPFPTYPHGFPDRVLDPFRKAIGRDILGNKPASGTEIIAELGAEHIRTGKPIVYTSADSVFQVAAHEEVIPIDELYRICRTARELLVGPDQVGRVIARPFLGEPGNFRRTGNRKDFAVTPPEPTLLDRLADRGLATVGVGKIPSIFDYRGLSECLEAHNNDDSVNQSIKALGFARKGLIFTNLVDFDMLWGHRRDSAGYARGLEAFDQRLPDIRATMREDDCLIISADHGCDPTAHGSDHTREYVPLLVCGKQLAGGVDLGTRKSMADIGQTIADNFEFQLANGTSFLHDLR